MNGITGVLLSSLFTIFFASFVFTNDKSFVNIGFVLWTIALYLLFSIIYIESIILCVHKGLFSTIKRKKQTRAFTMVSAFLGAAIPGTGLFGIYISRMIRYHMEITCNML